VRPKAHIVDLPVYQPGRSIEEIKRAYGLTEVIKLASNENPFGCSPRVHEAVTRALSSANRYPDGAATALRRALAAHLGVAEEALIFGNGSDEIVQLIARAYLAPGASTVMAHPTFPRYKTNAVIEGACVIEVPLKDGRHDLDAMAEAVTEDTRVVWVCNPNNPTGTIVTHDELVAFLARVPRTVLVVLDEAYVEYVTDPRFPRSLALLREHENLILLRTFSKIYGLAGFRIGYGIAAPAVIDALNRVREPFNTSFVAQEAALAALDDQAFVEACVQQNEKGKQQLYEGFARLGLRHYETHGNFILVDVGRPAGPVFEALLRQGVIVRSGEALGFPTALRVTIGDEAQNRRVLEALAAALVEA